MLSVGPPPTVHHSSCIHQAPVRSESEWWEGIDRAKAEKSDDLVPVDPDGDEGLLVPLGHLQVLGGVAHGRDIISRSGEWGGGGGGWNCQGGRSQDGGCGVGQCHPASEGWAGIH